MKVAIYCRLSDEDRNKQSESDDSESIQNQKSMLLQYALGQGWEVINIYSDDDYTGSDRNRPDFNRLLQDAEKRKFDIILCKTQSRFTRELELVEKYIHGLFPIWGIRFIGLVDNADTANKGNKKSRQINGLVNEWYLEDMSESIRSVLTNKRKNGVHIGSFALYGYKKDPEKKGHLIIDPEAANVVKEVYTLFSQGYGKTAIAKMLNDRGIPNPTEYKRLQGLRYQQAKTKLSTLWKYTAISDMLVNEIYIGNMVQGKYGSISYKTKINKPRGKDAWYVVKGTHEPIIDQELWENVQALVNEKAKPFKTGNIGLFAKKAKCSFCGYIMRSNKHVSGRHYLTCANRHVALNACEGAFISVEKLKKAVLTELNRLANEALKKDEFESGVALNSNIHSEIEKNKSLLVTFQKKINEYSKGIHDLYLDKVRGIITEKDFIDLSKDFSNEKIRLEHLINETQIQIEALGHRLSTQNNRIKIIEQYSQLTDIDRQTVEKLIDFIVVGKRIPNTYNVPVEIHWKF